MPTVAERFRFGELEKDSKEFLNEAKKLCKVFSVGDVEQGALMRTCNKEVLAAHLVNALRLIERQHELVINQRVQITQHQSRVVELQDDLIESQKQTIEEFNGTVARLKHHITESVQKSVEASVDKSYSTVVQSVQNSVESSVQKSYSSVVQSQMDNGGATFGTETLKSVAKQVIVEEELSRNVMVFGLPESGDEDLSLKMAEVFEHLEEKPRFEATRLGKMKSDAVRPVKVVLFSTTIAQQILHKSRKLRESEKHRTVFLSPDRTAEEREKHRELVAEIKRRTAEEPQKKHFIKAGVVVSND